MSDNAINSALAMAQNFENFLIRTTGDVDNDNNGLYVINSQGLINNNLHKINKTDIGPDTGGTTEAQSLAILGYIAMYEATNQPYWLERAEWLTSAYLQYYYMGQEPPNPPGVVYSNNNVNCRAPFKTAGPCNWQEPSRVGFRGFEIEFINGIAQIPHGYPAYGEKLLLATFAFSGELVWDSISARVDVSDEENPGVKYEIDYFIKWNGKKYSGEDSEVDKNPENRPIGEIKLKELHTGTLKLNFANTTGVVVGRNEPFEKYPAPHGVRVGETGSAIDSDTWLHEALALLYKYTQKPHYNQWFECLTLTLEVNLKIDDDDKYFRRANVITPFTDGVSYWWIYNDAGWVKGQEVKTTRDHNGYIYITKPAENELGDTTQIAFEQQAIWTKVNARSHLSLDFNSTDSDGLFNVSIDTTLTPGDDDALINKWRLSRLNPIELGEQEYKLSDFILSENETGGEYLPVANVSVLSYSYVKTQINHDKIVITGKTERADTFTSTILEAGQTDELGEPVDYGGLIIGFWSTNNGRQPIKSICYKASPDEESGEKNDFITLMVEDEINQPGVEWKLNMPTTLNDFLYFNINPDNTYYGPWLPFDVETGEALPLDTPMLVKTVRQIQISLNYASNTKFEFYCVNDLPPTFSEVITEPTYISHFKLLYEGSAEATLKIGDCYPVSALSNDLDYTPGAVTFSNNFSSDTGRLAGYRGIPYMGYQYPLIYVHHSRFRAHLYNITRFLYDSQQDYYQRRGVLGPVPGGYVWMRWDNTKSGPPQTFIDKIENPKTSDDDADFGTSTFWSGYYNRAMWAMCRLWEWQVANNQAVDPMVVEYCENWIKYLRQFQIDNSGTTPTEFPADVLPHSENGEDFNVAMTSHFLAGACACWLAGSRVAGIQPLIEQLFDELRKNQEHLEPENAMNGCWSAWAGGDYFYGFHIEAFRGIAYYIKYRKALLFTGT